MSTLRNPQARIGYVVKRYPRFSETFIVNEILAHEAAGLDVEIFSLRPPVDTHFQDALARVRAGVTYLPDKSVRTGDFWSAVEGAGALLPGVWATLAAAAGEDGLDVYQALLLARHARERGITHLHAHFASSATSVARLAARFAGLPYSFTAHAKDIFHESVRPDDLGRKLADAASVVTVSDYNLAYLNDTFGAAAARVERVYNGLDLARFPYDAPLDRPARIIAVGRIVEKKGFDVLVDACGLLARRGVRFTCQIVGGGELEVDVRARIGKHELENYVELLGPRPQQEVIHLVQGAAAFAAPCVDGSDGNRDGLPTVLLEAMALGTPCVSTDVTGIPEVLHHEETGLLVAQRDPHALADALERLLTDVALSVRLAEQARQLIAGDFDIHRNAARMRQAIGVDASPHDPQTSIERMTDRVSATASISIGAITG
ncbi:MAG: glycosyltransferase [Acidobacteriota bacterium]|nr:glycosyltransferase [Acidobacteriota bacterium]